MDWTAWLLCQLGCSTGLKALTFTFKHVARERVMTMAGNPMYDTYCVKSTILRYIWYHHVRHGGLDGFVKGLDKALAFFSRPYRHNDGEAVKTSWISCPSVVHANRESIRSPLVEQSIENMRGNETSAS